jgi:hypothetical protein
MFRRTASAASISRPSPKFLRTVSAVRPGPRAPVRTRGLLLCSHLVPRPNSPIPMWAEALCQCAHRCPAEVDAPELVRQPGLLLGDPFQKRVDPRIRQLMELAFTFGASAVVRLRQVRQLELYSIPVGADFVETGAQLRTALVVAFDVASKLVRLRFGIACL